MISVFISGTAREFLDLNVVELLPTTFRSVVDRAGLSLSKDTESNYLVNFNHNGNAYRKFRRTGGKLENTVLVRLEPEVVYPRQYRKSIEKMYGVIIDPGRIPSSVSSDFLGWPYSYHLNPALPNSQDPHLRTILSDHQFKNNFIFDHWKSRQIEVCMVLSNKVSPISSSNYTLRRKLAKESSPAVLKVYGSLWTASFRRKFLYSTRVALVALKQGTLPNLIEIYRDLTSSYPCAIGEVSNKHEVLRQSKYSLVIENSNSTVTEKLFDSLVNGCIPIYVGPDLSSIPALNAIIQRFPADTEINLKEITKLNDQEVKRILLRSKEYLCSPDFETVWSRDLVFEKIALKIVDFIKGRQK